MKIELSLNADEHDLDKIKVLNKAGFEVYGNVTNLNECLEFGYLDQDSIASKVFDELIDNIDEYNLEGCSEEDIQDLSCHLAKDIPNSLDTSYIEDQNCESVSYAISDYLNDQDLEYEFSKVQKEKEKLNEKANTNKFHR